jgi:hypothetical protein
MLVQSEITGKKEKNVLYVDGIDRASGSSRRASRRYNGGCCSPLSTSSFSVDEILII